MKNSFNYENIMKYDLTSFILGQLEIDHFSYIVIILDPSVSTEGYDKVYECGAIKEIYKWTKPNSNDPKYEDSKTKLYKTITRMKTTCKKFNYELYVASSSDISGTPYIRFITDEIITLTDEYNKFNGEFEGYSGRHPNEFKN